MSQLILTSTTGSVCHVHVHPEKSYQALVGFVNVIFDSIV